MNQATPAAMLNLWDQAGPLHPVDRNLLLLHKARPDISVGMLADLPLGFVNLTLLQMRIALFGEKLSAVADCAHCQNTLELPLNLADIYRHLQQQIGDGMNSIVVECDGFRFRSLTSRDLVMVSDEMNPFRNAMQLFYRCCINADDVQMQIELGRTNELMAKVADLFDEVDPATDLGFNIVCEHCGEADVISLDVGECLWREIDVYCKSLLVEIHTLASVYHWSESTILALSPQRRRQYLNMVMA